MKSNQAEEIFPEAPVPKAVLNNAASVFLIFVAVGIIFGIGGISAISRALGEGKAEYAKKVCSFQIVSAFLTDPDAFDYAVQFAHIHPADDQFPVWRLLWEPRVRR